MGKGSKKLRAVKRLGCVRKQEREVRHVTTFKELAALRAEGYRGLIDFDFDCNAMVAAEEADSAKGNKFEALYDDFIRKANKSYRESDNKRY